MHSLLLFIIFLCVLIIGMYYFVPCAPGGMISPEVAVLTTPAAATAEGAETIVA